MKRWHQFTSPSGAPTLYGHGADAEARGYLARRQRWVVANRYEMTSLDDDEEPVDDALVVDLRTGDVLPDRQPKTRWPRAVAASPSYPANDCRAGP